MGKYNFHLFQMKIILFTIKFLLIWYIIIQNKFWIWVLISLFSLKYLHGDEGGYIFGSELPNESFLVMRLSNLVCFHIVCAIYWIFTHFVFRNTAFAIWKNLSTLAFKINKNGRYLWTAIDQWKIYACKSKTVQRFVVRACILRKYAVFR